MRTNFSVSEFNSKIFLIILIHIINLYFKNLKKFIFQAAYEMSKMSNGSHECEGNSYIWVQGSLRGSACFVYGTNSTTRDYIRQQFKYHNDSPDGIYVEGKFK